MTTPRVFIIRHGETEWSLSGRHTGVTDIPLTANGEKRMLATGRAMVGADRLIVPWKLAHIYVSPRSRAQRTFELLNLALPEPLPWKRHGERESGAVPCQAKIEVTDDVREWDYGEYEGITSPEVRELRVRQGLDPHWDIWRDGCPGGESAAQVTARVDRLIKNIRDKYQAPVLSGSAEDSAEACGDVLVVAHGHILRALALRWSGQTLDAGPTFLMEAGGIGTLSYEHHNINEPAILLGGAFFVDILDQQEKEARKAT